MIWETSTGSVLGEFGIPGEREKFVLSPDGIRAASTNKDDYTALTWRLAGALFNNRSIDGALEPKKIDALWNDLADVDGSLAFGATLKLISLDSAAVHLLATKMKPIEKPGPELVERLIDDLDDTDYGVRRDAAKKLKAYGDCIVPASKSRLRGQVSNELGRALNAIVESCAIESPERLRRSRAVHVLECIGSVEAKELLKKLAAGASDASLTQDAQCAIQRLLNRDE